MRMELTINEEFGDTAALLDFAHRLKIMLAMPSDLFNKLAAGLAGVAVLNEKNSHRTAAERPAPAESVAEYPAVATPVQGVGVSTQTVNVGDAMPVSAVPAAHSPTSPADVAAPAPIDTRPRRKRGRPSNEEVAERTAAEAPKASTGGAAGVSADVVPPAARAPAKPAQHPLQEAIASGEAEAVAGRAFGDACISYASKDSAAYRDVLKSYGVTSARSIPEDKRAEFLSRCAAMIGEAVAA